MFGIENGTPVKFDHIKFNPNNKIKFDGKEKDPNVYTKRLQFVDLSSIENVHIANHIIGRNVTYKEGSKVYLESDGEISAIILIEQKKDNNKISWIN